jgi:hypothetical protein
MPEPTPCLITKCTRRGRHDCSLWCQYIVYQGGWKIFYKEIDRFGNQEVLYYFEWFDQVYIERGPGGPIQRGIWAPTIRDFISLYEMEEYTWRGYRILY